MSRFCVALTLVAGAAGDARGANRKKAFLSLASDMQPEVVARTLSEVEDEWKSQAASFAECNSTETSECGGAPEQFSKSCSTVVSAVVQAPGHVASQPLVASPSVSKKLAVQVTAVQV